MNFSIKVALSILSLLLLSIFGMSSAVNCECAIPNPTPSASTPDYIPPEGANNFYKSANLTCQKVVFKNQYKMRVAGNLFKLKNSSPPGSMPAIIVGHPMGAVKEQAANLYAQKLAEQGFVTLAIDLSYYGESEGQPPNSVHPDVYAEDFSAAVDFLGTRVPQVDRNRIGVLGICASGCFAISAAKLDPRLKAIATVSMYDMGDVTRNGLRQVNQSQQTQLPEQLQNRKNMLAAAAEQRYVEFNGGTMEYDGLPTELSPNADAVTREFFDFYRTPRGQYIPKGSTLRLTTGRRVISLPKFMDFYPFVDMHTISPAAMMFIAGEQAHSRAWSEQAYQLAAEPKELVIVPGAGHVDLYDRVPLIPFDRITSFFTQNLRSVPADGQ